MVEANHAGGGNWSENLVVVTIKSLAEELVVEANHAGGG